MPELKTARRPVVRDIAPPYPFADVSANITSSDIPTNLTAPLPTRRIKRRTEEPPFNLPKEQFYALTGLNKVNPQFIGEFETGAKPTEASPDEVKRAYETWLGAYPWKESKFAEKPTPQPWHESLRQFLAPGTGQPPRTLGELAGTVGEAALMSLPGATPAVKALGIGGKILKGAEIVDIAAGQLTKAALSPITQPLKLAGKALTKTATALLPSGEKTIAGIPVELAGRYSEELAQKTLTPRTQKWLKGKTIAEGLVDIEAYSKKGMKPELWQKLEPASPFVKEMKIELTKASKLDFPAGTVSLPPESLTLATASQKIDIHNIAKAKNLFGSNGKMLPAYRKLAKIVTGKTSTMKMTQLEAAAFRESLDNLVVYGTRPPRIPVTKALITDEFAKRIPYLKETGFIERFRQTPVVLQKIGLAKELWEPLQLAEIERIEALNSFRQQLTSVRNAVGKDKQVSVKIFDALDGVIPPELLSLEERPAYDFLKKNFDDWANKLKLPTDKRRENYVTHIFEEAITQDMKAKHPLDPELIRAMDFQFARKTFNPFLQKRLGTTVGLKRDPFLAADVYEQYALRQYYYQPLVKKIAAFEPIVAQKAPNAARQLRALANRLAGRPDAIDSEVNYSLREIADKLKGLQRIPIVGGKLADLANRGNLAAVLTHNYTSLLYSTWLGLRPAAALRNLSQQTLAVADAGVLNFAKGIELRFTGEGKAALAKSLMLRQRPGAFIPGVEASEVAKWTGRVQEIALWMFKGADRENIKNSFLAGYAKAKSLGLPQEWAIKMGDECAANTQFMYSKVARSMFEESALGRFMSPFTSWPRNWLELMTKWTTGQPSRVLQEYIATTGAKIKLPTNPIMKRKELITFMSLVVAAYAAESQSKVKVTEYTGWTSLRTLIELVGGGIPTLEIPLGIAQLTGGAMLGDTTLMKQGLNRVRPDRMIMIVRNLEDITQGKRDWLSLFLYMKSGQTAQESPIMPSGGGAPSRKIKR